MDNPKLQPDNFVESCKNLRITDIRKARLPNMTKETLTWWEIALVNKLWECWRKGLVNGQVVADNVGLGKTWVTAAFILHSINERAAAPLRINKWPDRPERDMALTELGPARPHIIVAPSGLLHNSFFNGDEETSKTMILTTAKIPFSRHRPKKEAQWRFCKLKGAEKRAATRAAIQGDTEEDSKPEFPGYLGRRFESVTLNEAHQVKNAESISHRCIRWLGADWTNLLTATPIYSHVTDYHSYLTFIEIRAKHLTTKDLRKINPYEDKYDDNDGKVRARLDP
ncbi:MAG: hypothetical protein M1820_008847 [Bogoriella megaspora]|nr:MAG: hypothetical protein M1820_008847 [Bogoriella megaspora]